jgi:PAS domain-containing protein
MSLLREPGRVRDSGHRRPCVEDMDELPGGGTACFEELFSSSPEGIVIYDRDGKIRRVNGTFCRMFGYDPEEVLGKDLDSLVATGRYYEEATSFTRANLDGERAFPRRSGSAVTRRSPMLKSWPSRSSSTGKSRRPTRFTGTSRNENLLKRSSSKASGEPGGSGPRPFDWWRPS